MTRSTGGVALALTLLLVTSTVAAQDKVLLADYRERPPEIHIDSKTGLGSGPLIEILDEAAGRIGYKVRWRNAPFPRSLKELQDGSVDVVPRVILTEERKAFVAYLGPIGYQQKDIVFLVRRDHRARIRSYDDLKQLKVGAKRDTAYFDRFDQDTAIEKILSLDDANMARMFVAGRFDTMIILDIPPIEKALSDIGFRDFAYADYKYVQRIGNYYGMSRRSAHVRVSADLDAALREMLKSGRVAEIYVKHGATPPRVE